MGEKKPIVLESCLGKAQEMRGLVDYSDEAIVSKTIVDKDAGTITLFAFDQGQNLSEHTTPYDAVVEVLDGVGTIVIAGERKKVSAGELIIMPANVPHAVEAAERFKMLLVMIRSQ